MCDLWRNGNKHSSDQWHNLLILTSLHHPGAAYCTQSSCQEHRRVPSLFSETSPSANNALLNTQENSRHFLKWPDVVTWVSRDWQSSAPAREHWRRCRFSIITWPNRSLMFTWINRQSPFRFKLKCAVFDKSWWKQFRSFLVDCIRGGC